MDAYLNSQIVTVLTRLGGSFVANGGIGPIPKASVTRLPCYVLEHADLGDAINELAVICVGETNQVAHFFVRHNRPFIKVFQNAADCTSARAMRNTILHVELLRFLMQGRI